MVNPSPLDDRRVLITGATGFIGHYLLAELLRRGERCAVLLRPPLDESTRRLTDMLGELGLDLNELQTSGQVTFILGDLVQGLPNPAGLNIRTIIHTAALTRFQSDTMGEPRRTNVTGTLALLRWAQKHQISDLHLVSSAYQCGKTKGPVQEVLSKDPPQFHNPYERTKWQAERACKTWSLAGPGRTLTVYRPSIVVGEYVTGRATKFSGFYLSARASQILAEQVDHESGISGGGDRYRVSLRVRGRAGDRQNIVPVDNVAAMIAHAVTDRRLHGRVYHLTHPDPPTNAQIKRAIESHYDIAGGRFVDPATFDPAVMNQLERLFYEVSRPIEHYFVDTPTFDRGEAGQLERSANVRCPAYDKEALSRLLIYADTISRWGRGKTDGKADHRVSNEIVDTESAEDAPLYDAYFKSFLPDRISRSETAKTTAVTVTMRFIIEDVSNGQWVCRFDRGRLVEIHRGENTLVEDFSYRTCSEVFWRAIAGEVHPQEAFLKRQARVAGNIEQALKMAMILHKFNQEFPCDRETLRREGMPV